MTRINELTQQWKGAKAAEEEAKARRLAVESAIYEIVAGDLPEKGTHTLESGMKVVTGFTEEWDGEAVTRAYQEWPEGRPFPFAGVWKPDGKAIAYLRDNEPALYGRISDALTLKPKKPAFSVKGE